MRLSSVSASESPPEPMMNISQPNFSLNSSGVKLAHAEENTARSITSSLALMPISLSSSAMISAISTARLYIALVMMVISKPSG